MPSLKLLLSFFLVALGLPLIHAQASSQDTLYLYSASTLANTTASPSCIDALTANITCYAGLSTAVTQTNTWSANALANICTDACSSSLADYVAAVNDACGTSNYNISGVIQTASGAGEEMIWKQTTTCLTDSSSGEYCNTYLQSAAANGTSGLACSECYLDYLSDVVNAEWGQSIISPDYFEAVVSSCSATGYSVTYTASSTSSSLAATSTATSNNRCNITDPDTTTYVVAAGDTCISISASQNVSTGLLASDNGLDPNCTYIATGDILCLPETCAIYQVQTNDTCTSIINGLDRVISLGTFLSWNSNINSICSNIANLVGKYVCISPFDTTTIPGIFPLQAATAAVPVPTDAVTTSNTDCGYWYLVQTGDSCDGIASEFEITIDNFYFLNPQLNGSCEHLWAGNSYCVEAVGDIATYAGYSSSITSNYTTLDSAIVVTAVQTVNRSTTHFFYSYPPVTTTTSAYNTSIYSMLESYTLCSAAMAEYNITDGDIPDEAYEDTDWLAEYARVCLIVPGDPLPTVGFNTSITLNITSTVAASTGASATASTASATATSLVISPDGTCGSGTGYTCAGSAFGDCCSIYGDCGSTSDYCGTNCDPTFGTCTGSSSSATTTSSTAQATSSVSPDGTCGSGSTGENEYTCAGSAFGNCCSIYGDCGSTSDYCGTNCDPTYGTCDTTSSATTTSSAAQATSSISPDGTCGSGSTDGNSYTCLGSNFGNCCSIYGYCGSTTDYCVTYCDSDYGSCD